MRFRLSVIALALSIVGASAENLPPAVKSAIAENSKSCKNTTVEPGFLTRQDINADGRPDYILDYNFVRCDGHERGLCGSLGCETEVFASLPNGAYAKVVDEIVRGGIRFRQVKGRPAIVLELRRRRSVPRRPDHPLRSRQNLERIDLRRDASDPGGETAAGKHAPCRGSGWRSARGVTPAGARAISHCAAHLVEMDIRVLQQPRSLGGICPIDVWTRQCSALMPTQSAFRGIPYRPCNKRRDCGRRKVAVSH